MEARHAMTTKCEKIGRVALFLAVMAQGCVVHAAPLGDDQALSIYAVAYGQTAQKLKLPRWGEFPGPQIVMTTPENICRIAGSNRPTCPVLAITKNGKVYISDTMDFSDVMNASILMHEYIHYFQWLVNGDAKDCQDWGAREIYAYEVQSQVLLKARYGEYKVADWYQEKRESVSRWVRQCLRAEAG